MRTLILVVLLSASVAAQQPTAAPTAASANLRLLAADANLLFVMQTFNEALGVECTHCHVQGDFVSEANPKKAIARDMIAMVRQIDGTFPSSAGVYPAGYHEVDCSTCHRGQVKPDSKAPREFFNRNESLGVRPPPPTPGINLKVLPPDTQVHGGGLMHEFRDALNVDCAYCHGGGRPFDAEVNPRKDIARNMILLVRQINTHFPGTGVFPNGPQAVTCYTCHRGEPHPVTVSNRRYEVKR